MVLSVNELKRQVAMQPAPFHMSTGFLCWETNHVSRGVYHVTYIT